MVKAHRFIYAKKFDGEPKVTDFKLESEELPAIKDNEFLAEAIYLSVDPYMRPYMAAYPTGVTMIGGQVAKILESKNPEFPVGATIFGQFGWRTHTIYHPDDAKLMATKPYVLPEFGDHPSSLGLGVIGMPGNTAYFGFLEICKPQAGETVVVSGAAGAVGSLVGQLAKSRGCRVVGLAGEDAKCAWLKTLGYDVVINYKTADVEKELRAAAPDGYDCYFDNVGGQLSSTILQQMRLQGRVSVCGSISSYNTDPADLPKVPILQQLFVFKQLTMTGFVVTRWSDRWLEGLQAMVDLVKSGKLQYQETVTEGFAKMPLAFIGMLRGENTGKAIVKIVKEDSADY